MKVVLSPQLVEQINQHARAVQHSLGRRDRPHGLLLSDQARLRQFLQQTQHPLYLAIQPHQETLEGYLRQKPVLVLVFLPEPLVVLLPLEGSYAQF